MKRTAAIVLGLVVLATPSQAAPDARSSTQTIRLVSTTVSFRRLVDHAPMGESNKGDVEWAKSVLRNAVPQFGRPKGAIVGSDIATLSVVSLKPPRGDVKVTVKLPGGTLRVMGRVGQERAPTIPVTGGTGDFAHARGTTEVRYLGGTRALNVYRLRLP